MVISQGVVTIIQEPYVRLDESGQIVKLHKNILKHVILKEYVQTNLFLPIIKAISQGKIFHNCE